MSAAGTNEWFESELLRHDWDHLRQASEQWRKDMPEVLTGLVYAADEPSASAAYFRLEGGCFPQRLVTESCVAVVHCLLAALAGRPPAHVRDWILEALFGILHGEPIRAEVDIGNSKVMADCGDAAKAGFWLLYGLRSECSGPDLENLQQILAALDPTRISWV